MNEKKPDLPSKPQEKEGNTWNTSKERGSDKKRSFKKQIKSPKKGHFHKKKEFGKKKNFSSPKRSSSSPKPKKWALEPEIQEKVDQLMKKNGLTFPFAVQVALEKKTLAQALKEMLHQQKIGELARKHKISKTLAGQVMAKQISLEEAIEIEKYRKLKKRFSPLSCFAEGKKRQEPFVLHCHGEKIRHGMVKKNDKYDIDWLEAGQSEILRLPKLEVKFAYPKKLEEKIKPYLTIDEEIASKKMKPIQKIVDRYRIKDRILRKYFFSPQKAQFTTLEGDILVGKILWFNQYEIFLEFEEKVGLYLLRHCLYRWELTEERSA